MKKLYQAGASSIEVTPGRWVASGELFEADIDPAREDWLKRTGHIGEIPESLPVQEVKANRRKPVASEEEAN